MPLRRRPPPKPPDPPPGFMWFFWDLVPIISVEARARAVMGKHDTLPRRERDAANEGREETSGIEKGA
jgi:hypothetical protein